MFLQILRACHTSCFLQVRDILQLIIRWLLWLDALLGLLCHIGVRSQQHGTIHACTVSFWSKSWFRGSQVFYFWLDFVRGRSKCDMIARIATQSLSAHATSGCLMVSQQLDCLNSVFPLGIQNHSSCWHQTIFSILICSPHRKRCCTVQSALESLSATKCTVAPIFLWRCARCRGHFSVTYVLHLVYMTDMSTQFQAQQI